MSKPVFDRGKSWLVLSVSVALALWVLAACAPAPAAAPAAQATQAPAAATTLPAAPTPMPVPPTATALPEPTLAPTAIPVAPTTVAAAATVTATAGLSRAEYQGVSFMYGAAVAQGARGETVAAEPGGSDAPWWVPVPQHTEIGLTGYVLTPTFHAPRIIVYPVAEFSGTNKLAAERIASLQKLLQTRPADPGKELPFLPLFNAAQQLHAGVKYLPFQGGQGVRYLTQYAQAPLPINNNDLFYTYQGLTDDGKYYVSALLPVALPGLPASYQSVSQSDMEALAQRFPAYINEMTQKLNTQTDASYTPSLVSLDALVQSIAVKP